MRLLFDHNLSPHLVERLVDVYPGASHTSLVGLDHADDEKVWDYARANGYSIVTKDADFNDLIVMRGFPPKVVWLRLGNCTTRRIEAALRLHCSAIEGLDADPGAGVLAVHS